GHPKPQAGPQAIPGVARVLAGTHVDIDALKRVEGALRAATLQAQAASEAKGRLLSGISHELRTPLNAILGFAQLMRMDCDDSGQSEAAEYLDEILLASRHLNQLLGEILEWSSLQKERPQLELQPVGVCSLMRECAELVALEVQQRGLQLDLNLPDDSLLVLAEPRRLRQVLLNLLSNAMKYNVPNGHISLRAESSPEHVRILVEDTGLGIDPAQQAQVFEPFQRLGRENSMIQGTGIGLSLCLEFARLMNGQLGLHSEPGVGSRFWIELPRVVPAQLQ
ncbi:MAG: histidine kinase, partial [Gammaproteobacteria bacterium HGW-Gammaproteobacteria-7]